MSNAAKHRKKAAEFEQLKQIDRAIAAYIKSIEESESAGEEVDVALFNKVGDLALRQGRVPDAITYYERAVEHYATSGLFNNAIALCNKILRSAPGRANVYFTLGRICARKGLRGDATKNFLEYATRMREEGRVDEGMRALAEIADLSPELTEVRKLVDEYAQRAGISLPRRMTPPIAPKAVPDGAPRPPVREEKSQDLVFIQVDYGQADPAPLSRHVRTPAKGRTPVKSRTPVHAKPAVDPLAAALIEPGPGLQLLRNMATPVAPLETIAAVSDLLTTASPEASAESTAEASAAVADPVFDLVPVVPLEGLEANGNYDADVPALEGLTVDDTPPSAVETVPEAHVDGLPLVPHELETTAFGHVDLLQDVVVEDFEHAAEDPAIAKIIATETPLSVDAIVVDPTPLATATVDDELPPASDVVVVDPTPLDVEAVPELEAAIATGEATAAAFELETLELEPVALDVVDAAPVQVARITPLMLDFDLDTVEEHAPPTRPPFRVDPHDFILPGELPPLLLEDAIVDAGLAAATAPRATPRALTPIVVAPVPPAVEANDDADTRPDDDGLLDVEAELAALSTPAPLVVVDDAARIDVASAGETVDAPSVAEGAEEPTVSSASVEAEPVGAEAEPDELPSEAEFDAAADSLETVTVATPTPMASQAVTPTPALPIAAVAAEATIVASSRRDALRAAVSRLPHNWMLRRRLAEALLESGEREEALTELETARQGFIDNGDLATAADIGDEMVHVSPERIAYHQRRVELSVAMHDLQRLRMAYLDLADALVRLGEEGRARAVYARVLEIDPLDDRARTALGAAAPPPPPPSPRPDDDFVDLTTWLKDDDGQAGDTRLRMREPVISGDEQADFDELLRHFKEGVARSLGEDDFESHYDLGVAYKEMGLLDDAIAEFQKALRSHGNRLPAYEALGQCFVEQGRHQVAATVLTRALHEPGLGDEQRVGVLYLLAFSCEALQRFDEARSYYQRVYATDIQFRDAAARLAALEHIAR
jgi:tetratricopeptide (TPR) repeat protein